MKGTKIDGGFLRIELDNNEDALILKKGIENERIGIYFESGEGGDFSLEDFTQVILKFYRDHF